MKTFIVFTLFILLMVALIMTEYKNKGDYHDNAE